VFEHLKSLIETIQGFFRQCKHQTINFAQTPRAVGYFTA